MWSISVDEVGEIRVGFVIVGSKPNESKVSRYSLVFTCSWNLSRSMLKSEAISMAHFEWFLFDLILEMIDECVAIARFRFARGAVFGLYMLPIILNVFFSSLDF